MESYICENVFVPLRSGPSHKSEMLSQVLFGEKYLITDEAGKWIRIRTLFDNYEGWIDLDHLQHSVSNDDRKGKVLVKSLFCEKSDRTRITLEPGSEIYDPDFSSGTFSAGSSKYRVTGSILDESCFRAKESMPETALRFINSPYIWGGRIPSGIDCSGLTQLVYKIHGIPISRDASQQAVEGSIVSFISEAVPGDLVFFDNEYGKITHVGMIFSEGLVIHASGRVRIDAIDHQGIFKQETGKYSHHLRVIRRVC